MKNVQKIKTLKTRFYVYAYSRLNEEFGLGVIYASDVVVCMLLPQSFIALFTLTAFALLQLLSYALMYILLSFCGRSVASVEVLVSSRLILILSRLYCSCCGWVPVNWRREMLYNMWVPSGGDEKRHFPILRIYSRLRESKYKSPSIADMRLTRGLATSPLSSSLCVSRSACLSNSLSLSRSLSLSSSLVLFLCFSPVSVFLCLSVYV